jgi:hypothetical protein
MAADSFGGPFVAECVAAAITGPLAIATPATVHLAQAPFTPGPSVTLAGITEATFDGYSDKTITSFGTVQNLGGGSWGCNSGTVTSWTPTGSTTPNTIAGWVVVDHAGNMVSNGAINPPQVLDGATTTLALVWGFALTGGVFTSTVLP